ncbi:hypothetical protein DPEC_G00349800 [Dallia pectoralis]|uniref:Uncharacterized protein n=1 Tax=Dallia pectoralis TaxID=75939 RepID=A0ACC2F1K4_DALPE|nr:hypothetical protein DPEC_G00349800 [Dallia pectoralis]
MERGEKQRVSAFSSPRQPRLPGVICTCAVTRSPRARTRLISASESPEALMWFRLVGVGPDPPHIARALGQVYTPNYRPPQAHLSLRALTLFIPAVPCPLSYPNPGACLAATAVLPPVTIASSPCAEPSPDTVIHPAIGPPVWVHYAFMSPTHGHSLGRDRV